MTPFPHLKQTSQEAGGTPGVKKFQRKLQMNFKEDFFLGHPVCFKIYGQSNNKVYTTLFRVFNKSDIPTCEQKKSAKFFLEELSLHKFFCSKHIL